MNTGAKTTDTTVMSLMRILIEGPAVSLNGSPTVSPTTAQPVKEVSPSHELFGIMGKKRTGGEKNGTVATG